MMDDTLYPRFSDAEMTRRREAMTAAMQAAGVSHLVLYGSERVGGAIPWLIEWPVTAEAAATANRSVIDESRNKAEDERRRREREAREHPMTRLVVETFGGAIKEIKTDV